MGKKGGHLRAAIGLTVVITLSVVFSIRFLYGANTETTHYHAGFAIYINGNLEKLENPGNYVETSACGGDFTDNPLSRVHLHKPHPHVIHIHDKAVSWQHFFNNIGWSLNNKWLANGDNFYRKTDSRKLRFILNGQQVDYPTSKVIENGDVLLIDYGSDPIEVLHQRFIEIKREDVFKANLASDPASCGGAEELSLFDRIIRAVDVRN